MALSDVGKAIPAPCFASGIYLPYIYHIFTIYLPYIYQIFTIYLPYIYHIFTIYLPYIYHIFIIYLPYIGIWEWMELMFFMFFNHHWIEHG